MEPDFWQIKGFNAMPFAKQYLYRADTDKVI